MLESIISFSSLYWISYCLRICSQISTNSLNNVFSIKISENLCEQWAKRIEYILERNLNNPSVWILSVPFSLKGSSKCTIREIFCENPRIIFVLFYDVHKENMFTINLGDGREAPSKARKKDVKRLEFLVPLNSFI